MSVRFILRQTDMGIAMGFAARGSLVLFGHLNTDRIAGRPSDTEAWSGKNTLASDAVESPQACIAQSSRPRIMWTCTGTSSADRTSKSADQ